MWQRVTRLEALAAGRLRTVRAPAQSERELLNMWTKFVAFDDVPNGCRLRFHSGTHAWVEYVDIEVSNDALYGYSSETPTERVSIVNRWHFERLKKENPEWEWEYDATMLRTSEVPDPPRRRFKRISLDKLNRLR